MNEIENLIDQPINGVSKVPNEPDVYGFPGAVAVPPVFVTPKKPTTAADWLVSPQFKKSLTEVLPKNLSPERICRIALNEFRKNPNLQQCSVQSFLGAVMNASTLGLEIGETLGHAYLIPRKGQCQFHLGYKGMIELANRAGVLVTSNLVYEGDEFYAEYGNEERLKHIVKPHLTNTYQFVYAYIRTKEDKFKMEIMSPADINKIMERSPSSHKPDSPWTRDFNAMAKKTVIRQLFKYMPISNDLSKAIALDEQAELGIQHNDFQIDVETTNE